MKIALITSEATRMQLTSSQKNVVNALHELEIAAPSVPWTSQNTDWSGFNALLISSCWDYHLRIPEFQKWLDLMDRKGIRALNDTQVIRKNMTKTYLKDLDGTLPTLWYDPGQLPKKEEVLKTGWEEVVIKPWIGASGHATFRVPANVLEQFNWKVYPGMDTGYMIQPFIPEVKLNGELSLIFFGGQYSHTVLKTNDQDDFRIQSDFGGTHKRVYPDDTIIQLSRNALRQFGDGLLYGRIDGVMIEHEFFIMEVELIEPELFISDNRLARRFADAINEAIRT